MRNKRVLVQTSIGLAIVGLAAFAVSFFGGTGSAEAIINGEVAGRTPWQVSVQDSEGHFCGGVIIDEDTIVTAAHCLEGFRARDLRIRAGSTNLIKGRVQNRRAETLVMHPRYARDGKADIGYIVLDRPLNLNAKRVGAIELATAADIAAVSTATVSGWGDVNNAGRSSNRLRVAEVPLVSDSVCMRVLRTHANTELCAGGTGTDSCFGDSGGPLLVETADGPRLAGIVSWGLECGGTTPGVYAEIPTFANFLS